MLYNKNVVYLHYLSIQRAIKNGIFMAKENITLTKKYIFKLIRHADRSDELLFPKEVVELLKIDSENDAIMISSNKARQYGFIWNDGKAIKEEESYKVSLRSKTGVVYSNVLSKYLQNMFKISHHTAWFEIKMPCEGNKFKFSVCF